MRSLPHIHWCAADPGKDSWGRREWIFKVALTRPTSVSSALRLGPRALQGPSDSTHERKVVPRTL